MTDGDRGTRIEGDDEADSRVVIMGERLYLTHPLPAEGRIVLGRDESANVVIPDASVSRRHACVHVGNGLVMIEDLGSSNGTTVNGNKISPENRVRITPADAVKIGRLRLLLELPVGAAPPGATPAPPEPNPDESSFRLSFSFRSPAMKRLYDLLGSVSSGTINVLLLGETGVGKEVFARTIHSRSPRASKPFVALNCATFSETLLESELFGYEKGAFTGAQQAKPGLLEVAEGGTVFLDEVGELPVSIQAKLLRVLDDRHVLRVGSTKIRAIDVRFVTATNRNLEAEIEAGRFRRDLFFRLNGITLRIPALRERTGEIEPLAREFIRHFCDGRPAPALSPEAVERLLKHHWPGNVRELRNVIERAVLLCGPGPIGPEHLHLDAVLAPTPAPPPRQEMSVEEEGTEPLPTTGSANLWKDLEGLERTRIVDALEQCAGNQTRAAKLLGISRRTLITKLEQYGLPRPRAR